MEVSRRSGRQQGPERYSYNEVIAGADLPAFTGARLAGSWAEFESDGSFSLADVMGQDEARAMWEALTESIESRQSNLLAMRPDLAFWVEE